eukprot:Sspe_Gene.96467::Locus_69200_Transcript_1_1_Confidence_1.000_Length_2866::g.96467::m.96467
MFGVQDLLFPPSLLHLKDGASYAGLSLTLNSSGSDMSRWYWNCSATDVSRYLFPRGGGGKENKREGREEGRVASAEGGWRPHQRSGGGNGEVCVCERAKWR